MLEREEVGKIMLARRNSKNSHHAVGCKCQNITRARLIYLSHKKITARTTKRFPLSRCASAIQIVRPLQQRHLSLRRSNAIRVML